MDEVTRKRIQRIERAVDITPLELLRMVIDDIERGETKCDGLMVVWCRRPKDEDWAAGTYRAGLSRDQELVQLRLAEERLLRVWLGDDT